MPDQELTALRIKIEADVENAIKLLQSLATKVVAVENTVRQSVGKITASLKSIDGKTIGFKVDIQGKEELDNFKKKLNDIKAAAGNTVVGATSGVRSQGVQRKDAVVPSESGISSFVSAVKSGVAVSVEELKKFRTALTTLFESKQLRLGVDNTEVIQLKKDLEFLNGFINASKRDIKVRVSTDGDQEIKNKLNNLQKDYVLRIIPSFNDADFNKLLTEIQNKRINLTFEDVSDAIKEEIRQVESITANLPIGADTSAYDAKVNGLKNSLTKVQAIQVNANTAPAELSLKQLQQRAATILAKQQELKLRAQILLPSGELSALQATKKRLEADKIRLKGTAEFGDINTNLEAVKRRIAELNAQGIKLQVTTGDIISQASVQRVNTAIALVKDLKRTAGDIRIDFRGNGLDRLNSQANQTVRNFEQIIRDTPSFAISAQQGFIAISNNIGPLTDSFGRLAAEAKASGQSIGSALKGALGGWNAIGIAISLAVTGVVLFGKQIFGASKEAKKLEDIFDRIKETVESIKTGDLSGIASQQGDLAEVQSIIDKILKNPDAVQSLKENAVKRLQGIDPEAFKGINAQRLSIEDLDKAYLAYKQTLLATSVLEQRKTNINNLSAQQGELEVLLRQARQRLDIARENFDLQKKQSTAGQAVGGVGGSTASPLLAKAAKEFKAAEANLENLKKVYGSVVSSIQTEQDKLNAVIAGTLVPDPSQSSGGSADDTLKRILQSRRDVLESELKNISEISERYFVIQTEIAGLDLQIKNIGEVNSEVRSNNFAAYQNGLEGINIAAKAAGVELTNLKLTLQDPTFFKAPSIEPFAKLRDDAIAARLEIDKLFKSGSLTEGEKLTAEVALEFKVQEDVLKAQKELDSFQLLIKTGIAPQLQPVIPDQTIPALPELADDAQMLKDMGYAVEDWNQKLRNSLQPMEEFQKRAEELNREIANIVASGISDLFGELFDNLAEDGKITFQELGQSIAKFAQDLIKAVAKLLIFKAVLSAFGIADLSGILGTFTRPRKFATGGIVTGPTFGIVGEAGPEAVLPLSFLNNLFTNTGGSANLQARVSGQDLLFVMERANKANNRFF